MYFCFIFSVKIAWSLSFPAFSEACLGWCSLNSKAWCALKVESQEPSTVAANHENGHFASFSANVNVSSGIMGPLGYSPRMLGVGPLFLVTKELIGKQAVIDFFFHWVTLIAVNAEYSVVIRRKKR